MTPMSESEFYPLMLEARAAFDEYAGMNPPELPPPGEDDRWSQLQVRAYRWENHNFGYQPEHTQALGMGEEIGEMAEALLAAIDHEVVDGGVDVKVFGIQLLTSRRLDFGTIYRAAAREMQADRKPDDFKDFLLVVAGVGRIQHALLKEMQKIRGFHEKDKADTFITAGVYQAVQGLRAILKNRGTDQSQALEQILERIVLKRNWAKNAVAGTAT